ncbi:DUF2809 domain-containing protein [Flavobacterium sp.]|uniref:ribosomal maturation YjgA family protein n=1 Tax=Flavobacterium sp. TaxID=239 RepID=UPI0026136200|nr:DUF2809 domain-containing protein [Flavobacterium sp.]
MFYFIVTFLVVLLGVLSRKTNVIPLFIGDVLYAVMVYFGFRILLLRGGNLKKIMFPLCFCFLIELQQLYNAEWIMAIRNTTLGHYALGQGFLWSDLVCYIVGVTVAFRMDAIKS